MHRFHWNATLLLYFEKRIRFYTVGYNQTHCILTEHLFVEFNQQDNNHNSIISVSNNIITLSHTTLAAPCFISPNYHTETPNLTLEKLDKATLFPLTSKNDIKLLIIGTGKIGKFLNPQQQVALQQMGIGVESMNNESACRSFNLLLSDARLVGLLLL